MPKAHVPAEIKARVHAEINRCREIAEEAFDRKFAMPNVRYDKQGTTAGTASDARYEINLNSVLLMENLDNEFIEGKNSTVGHEFAHLVNGLVYPETHKRQVSSFRCGKMKRSKASPHGPTWKRIMMILGYNSDNARCHNYDVENAKVKKTTSAKHVYACKTCNGEMKIGNQRHAKLQKYLNGQVGGARYWKRGCGRHAGYNYVGLEGQIQKPAPKITATVSPTPARKGSKLETAIKLMSTHPTMERKAAIKLIALACGMSEAGAQTYYYKAKKAI